MSKFTKLLVVATAAATVALSAPTQVVSVTQDAGVQLMMHRIPRCC
jgi:hypothetical protein